MSNLIIIKKIANRGVYEDVRNTEFGRMFLSHQRLYIKKIRYSVKPVKMEPVHYGILLCM